MWQTDQFLCGRNVAFSVREGMILIESARMVKKMECKFSFQRLDLTTESSNRFYTNAINCEITDFMTSSLKKRCC